MKRSFLTVLAASSLLVLGACSADDNSELDTTTDNTTIPAPAPVTPMPMDSTMMTDTTNLDTTVVTTTGM